MKNTKVVFMGSRPLGYFALKALLDMPCVEVVGSFVKRPSEKAWWNLDPYEIAPNVLTDHSQLADLDFDFGVSINYWKIIEQDLINRPKLGFINLHHSYNLCLRGRDMTSHAIISARDTGRHYHGTTLHYTDDGLDTGPIIAARSCSICETDTAWTLFNKVEALGEELVGEWLPRLVKAKAPAAYPEVGQPLNWRMNEEMKFVANLDLNPLRAYDLIRAYDFNGYFMPAYTIIKNSKVYLTTRPCVGIREIVKIDSSRSIYSTNWTD